MAPVVDCWCNALVVPACLTGAGVLEEHIQTTAETGKAVLKQTAQGLAQTPTQIFQMLGAGPRYAPHQHRMPWLARMLTNCPYTTCGHALKSMICTAPTAALLSA